MLYHAAPSALGLTAISLDLDLGLRLCIQDALGLRMWYVAVAELSCTDDHACAYDYSKQSKQKGICVLKQYHWKLKML